MLPVAKGEGGVLAGAGAKEKLSFDGVPRWLRLGGAGAFVFFATFSALLHSPWNAALMLALGAIIFHLEWMLEIDPGTGTFELRRRVKPFGGPVVGGIDALLREDPASSPPDQ